MVVVFKNAGEWSTAKNYCPVILLSVVSKVNGKLVNNIIVDRLEKCGLFSEFQYGFWSSRSTADLLIVVSDRTVGLLTGLGLHELWHLIYPRLSTKFGMLVFFTSFKYYEFPGQIFGLISSFLSNRRLWVVLDGKCSQEYPGTAGVPQGSILSPTLFLLYINDLPDYVICNIAIYADDSTLYSKRY